MEEAGRGGWVVLGMQLGCALRSSVLSGKLFTPPAKVRREEKRKERELCAVACGIGQTVY